MTQKEPNTEPEADPHFALAVQVSSGDGEAMRQLAEVFDHTLKDFVGRRLDGRLRSRVDASDIVQEAMVEAHRRMDGFIEHHPMPLRIWLIKLAWERLLKAREKHLLTGKRDANREVSMDDRSSLLLASKLVGHSTPSRAAVKRERDEKIAQCVSLLAENDREILLLRHVEGFRISTLLRYWKSVTRRHASDISGRYCVCASNVRKRV